jgi:surface polysaccharide O-acyltransferase-like enzyme
MREHLRSALVGSAQGLGVTLAGAPWWAVMMLAFGVTVLTYLIVYVLARNPRTRRVRTPLITWEAVVRPEEPPDTS